MAKPNLAAKFLLCFALAAVPLTAFAATEPPAKSTDYYTKRVCDTVKVTGSRLGGARRCRTQAEREEARKQARTTVDRVQAMKPVMCMPPHPC